MASRHPSGYYDTKTVGVRLANNPFGEVSVHTCLKTVRLPVMVVVAVVFIHASISLASTDQDFDGPGTRYMVCQFSDPPAPTILEGEHSGRYLRLATTTVVNNNSIAFDRSDLGHFSEVVARFEIRMFPPPGADPADGIGFALLNTAEYGTSGPVCPPPPRGIPEEPNFVGSIGVGFDIYQNTEIGDINDNHVSIHYDGEVVGQFDSLSGVRLASGAWIQAEICISTREGFAEVSVFLGEQRVEVVKDFEVRNFRPYEARVFFGARSGGLTANHDLDNIAVEFGTASSFTFGAPMYTVVERAGTVRLTVNHTGSGSATVRYATADGTARSGMDYAAAVETLTFADDETSKVISIPLVDDALEEDLEETFTVTLSDPSSGSELGENPGATVTIVDDDCDPSRCGQWGNVMDMEIVAAHMHLLPTGKVLFWPGDVGEGDGEDSTFEDPRLWNPAKEEIEELDAPPHNLFCSGHSFLPDGRLLISGGHQSLNVGLRYATIYCPDTGGWTKNLPNMNDGRWYPTNTTLANGDVLVMSGSVLETPFTVNNLLQVWETEKASWRDLPGVQFETDWHLYPWNFVGPDSRVFVAGPDQVTHFIDTSGVGMREPGPPSNFGIRTHGSAVMYDDGNVLIVGGATDDEPPTNSAEMIGLTSANPTWEFVMPMTFPRQYHNATLLPDGTVLVTGGTRSPGFNNAVGAVFPVEIWDPDADAWQIGAAMRVPRVYHSTALLLPDGRVLSAGGGQPAATGHGVDNENAEIYSPPYLFKGPRPALISVPTEVAYGETFFVETADTASIEMVNWIRLSSVTHAFDQNQRLNRLTFSRTSGGLSVEAPGNPNEAPPGHYMLFILNGLGAPSEARFVMLSFCESNSDCDDRVFCNGDELCVERTCVHGGSPCEVGATCNEELRRCEQCQEDVDCPDDGDVCTIAVCTEGTCETTARKCDVDASDCDDGSWCNGQETCFEGCCQTGDEPCATNLTCVEAAQVCECDDDADCTDANSCTQDVCAPADPGADAIGCVYDPTPLDGTGCNDGNSCTSPDTCSDGTCTGPSSDPCCGNPDPCCGVECVNGDLCTIGTCQPLDGSCRYEPISCPDRQTCDPETGTCVPCTADTDCDDDNACTDDTCDSSHQCVFTSNDTNTCDDGDVCNGAEVCQAGTCVNGTPLDCNDDNLCTDDPCDPTLGCVVTPDDTNACADGDFCNGIETCDDGECADGVPPCVDDEACDESSDVCFIPCLNQDDCPGNQLCIEERCVWLLLVTTVPSDGVPIPSPEEFYLPGTEIEVFVPDPLLPGDVFTGWTGDVPDGQIQANPLVLEMDASKTVNAVFQAGPCDGPNDCDDGQFCNGAEECIDGACQPGEAPCPGACDVCDDNLDICVSVPPTCGSDCSCTPGAPTVGLIFLGLLGLRFFGSGRRTRGRGRE